MSKKQLLFWVVRLYIAEHVSFLLQFLHHLNLWRKMRRGEGDGEQSGEEREGVGRLRTRRREDKKRGRDKGKRGGRKSDEGR